MKPKTIQDLTIEELLELFKIEARRIGNLSRSRVIFDEIVRRSWFDKEKLKLK